MGAYAPFLRLRAFFAPTRLFCAYAPMRHGAKQIYWRIGDWRKKFKIDAL